jgi:predicted enzyme related to lactoylglutathione lyase
MARIQQFAMVIIPEPDVQEAVAFYQKLGLELKFQVEGKWAEFDLQGVKLGLCPSNNPPVEGHTGIVLAVDDVREMYTSMKDSITFCNEPVEAVHGIMVSVKDPGGNILDLYQPTPEKVKEYMEGAEQAGGCCKGESSEQDSDSCCKS